MADVFISYKRRIRPRVEELVDALQQLKLSIWYDAGLEPGKSFGAVINREVAAARCVIVCWTPDAFAPEDGNEVSWVESEATLGRERKILVPTLFEKTMLNAPWNMLHTENLTTWTADAAPTGSWLGVLAAIGKYVERPGLAEYVRSQGAGTAEALTRWAQTYPDDPLIEDVWTRVTELEVAAAKAKVEADRTRRQAPPTQAPPVRQQNRAVVPEPELLPPRMPVPAPAPARQPEARSTDPWVDEEDTWAAPPAGAPAKRPLSTYLMGASGTIAIIAIVAGSAGLSTAIVVLLLIVSVLLLGIAISSRIRR